MHIPERLIARGPIEPAIYVVSTPIGNLGDLTLRALRVLSSVEVVLAEDTRRARQLLSAYGLSPRLVALHQHNEVALAPKWSVRPETYQSLWSAMPGHRCCRIRDCR